MSLEPHTLPAEITIRTISDVRAQLEERRDQGELSLTGIETQKIDAVGVQLLAMFRAEVTDAGGSFSWQEPGEAITAAAKLLGADELLGLEPPAA